MFLMSKVLFHFKASIYSNPFESEETGGYIFEELIYRAQDIKGSATCRINGRTIR